MSLSACLLLVSCSVPHPVKGESIYAYVTVLDDVQPSAKLHAELVNLVKTQIGSFAAPDVIHWAPGMHVRWLVVCESLRCKGACIMACCFCFCRPARKLFVCCTEMQ